MREYPVSIRNLRCQKSGGVGGRWVFATVLLVVSWLISTHAIQAQEVPAHYEPKNCAQCHLDSEREMEANVHHLLLPEQGNMGCLSCHQTHPEPGTVTYGDLWQASNAPLLHGKDLTTCGDCHQEQVRNYYDSYHGKHFALGKTNVPTCVTCHASHELPLDDSRSPLHADNIGFTCAQCHGGDVGGKALMTTSLSGHWTGDMLYDKVYWLRLPITALSWIAFFAAVGLAACLCVELVRICRAPASSLDPIRGGRTLALHLLVLFLLFFALDQSGLVLLYSEGRGDVLSEVMSKVTSPVRGIFADADTRSLVHRLAGGLLVVGLLGHFLLFVIRPQFWNCVRIRREDWTAFRNTIPLFRRKKDVESTEQSAEGDSGNDKSWGPRFIYWAILPLVVVMVLTGLYQWFMFGLMRSVGFTTVDIADLIHEGAGRALSVLSYFVLVVYVPARFWLMRSRRKQAS